MAGVAGVTARLRLELLLATLLAAAAGAALPLLAGEWAWSWDALNHHVYLGLIAEQPRWHLDVIPASYQTYQYPYLYWPVYRRSRLEGSGAWVGAVWSAFQAACLMPPVWTLAQHLLPEDRAVLPPVWERASACLLAFMSMVVISSLQTTANDLLAAVPLLWALALWTHPSRTGGRAALAAACLGVALAFKLSNALFLPLLFVWWWRPGDGLRAVWQRGVAQAVGFALGFGLAYAPWGWQLWSLTGQPFYPYLLPGFGGA